jgi:hypothetical protein
MPANCKLQLQKAIVEYVSPAVVMLLVGFGRDFHMKNMQGLPKFDSGG